MEPLDCQRALLFYLSLKGERGENFPSAVRFFALSRHRDDLHQRIDARVEAMFRQGLVAETAALLDRGLAQNKVASQALGYRQVIDHLQKGVSLEETAALVKLRTRQFAKRQMTWFRHQLPSLARNITTR
jgi:tRNA dimethylallyltransferase